ncbi:MAG: GAF domain-containing protein [Anaerolineae bacterium]
MSAAAETSPSVLTATTSAASAQSARRGVRALLVVAIASLVLSGLFAALALGSALTWWSQPFAGVLTTSSLVVDGSNSLSNTSWPGLAAGIRAGDRLTALNGTPLTADTASLRAALSGLAAGDTVSVQTAASPAPFTYTLTTFPAGDWLIYFGAPFAAGLVLLIAGVALVATRSNLPIALVVVITLASTSAFMTLLFDLHSTGSWVPIWLTSAVLAAGLLITVSLIFPGRVSLAQRQPWLIGLPPAVALFLSALLIAVYQSSPSPAVTAQIINLGLTLPFAGLVVLTLFLWTRRNRVTTLLARDQLNTVLISAMLSLAVGMVYVLNQFVGNVAGQSPLAFPVALTMPFFAIPGVALAFAVSRRRAFNSDRAVSTGLTYTLLLLALTIGYFLLVLAASLITGGVLGADSPLLIAIVIFVMAIAFLPVRDRVQAQVDRLYFKRQEHYQTELEAFSRSVSVMSDLDSILAAYRANLQQQVDPELITIFMLSRQTGEYVSNGQPATDMRFSPNGALVGVLSETDSVYLEPNRPWPQALVPDRGRLRLLKALMIVPFRGANQLHGFVILSGPRSGQDYYSHEHQRFINDLTAQANVSVERAQVVASLERRVRELDVLTQVSQAVNFTVEFDDLLELISTQTQKLIEATHFYIVMLDPASRELYYAFFLENDERYPDRENQRWVIGNDLLSEVVRTGQTLRFKEYARALEERNLTYGLEDPHIKAWMAVPLTAGTRILGAMAVANNRPGRIYGDDQLKIFNDISALAATSIDKARLFRETNVRARQLSVLNDISRQIVASEANLEGLLELITGRATEILNAEAGSLLLDVEDGTGDLEFRVAIGGSGPSIVGRRIPAKRGLVGQVAATGEPVIVNDVVTDSRWAGELTKSGGFQTNTVLAVPLVTQDSVIGVLEVLNKHSGAFTPDDQDLLTSFASQAAVAIENARLFQLTDQQLAQRVSELETLERIDFELNRSLDLAKIARITVEWAVQNTSATAGMLGVVTGEPPMLSVVFRQGYPDELPDELRGGLLRLDTGIVRRVMRTKQADLTTDVSIDPDYVVSLPDARSQITIPMLSGGQVLALLVLESDRPHPLRLADMPFLQRLAEHAAIAISNAQLYAELSRANQSKSEFVSFVAHELKNPLTSIRGYSDFLIGGAVGGLSDIQRNFVNTIRSNADRMTTLVSDLNDVTKLETGNMRIDARSTAFSKIVDETVAPLQKQIEDKGQKLVVDTPSDLPPIYADEGRIVQVMINLVSNATKYSPEDATITITATPETHLRDAKGRPIPPRLHVQVRDTGIGMSDEDVRKLFTPYFRSDNPQAREQPGTGLGLTITRGIIARHNGEIWVESKLGEGTAFHFTVPLAAAAEPQA